MDHRRRRQLFGDEKPFFASDSFDNNFLQDLDVTSIFTASNLLPISGDNCPLETIACDPKYPYRSLSGYCNNLRSPNFGKSLTTFLRLLPAVYENGISKPRLHSTVNRDISLPSSRLVSSTMHLDISHLDSKHSMMLMQFAQFLDHDITLTPVYRGFFLSIPDCRSCDSPQTVHPECMPIKVPEGDPYYPQVNHTTRQPLCLPFMRSLPGQQRFGAREQLNQISGVLDLTTVYGDSECLSRSLRTFFNGRLNTTNSIYGDKDLLPQTTTHPECRASSGYCFAAGDKRASEQPALTIMHTIFMREHNRIADSLKAINPHWQDEKLYQEAKRIFTAKYQHIVYNEFLPRMLGLPAMDLYGISLERPGQYYEGYSDDCNPQGFTEFATAAFRIGHSLLRPFLPRLSPSYQLVKPFVMLRDTFFNPYILYQRHAIDEMIRGLYSTPAEQMDQFMTKEITNRLFEDKRIPHSGVDLVALNIQRGRDHGMPSYNDFRERCNLKRAIIWEDFSRELPNDVIDRLRRIYIDVNDVDLFPAGISERPIQGGMIGPTFACIIGLQFRQLRTCDRFWYETSNPILKFSPDQLAEIRKASLSKILCDNMDISSPIQRYSMDLADEFINPRLSCQSLLDTNLNAWRETADRSFCQFNGKSFNIGDTALPSPCTSCICTPQDMKCASIRVTNCIQLIQEVGESAVLKDEVCAAQCSAYISTPNNSNNFQPTPTKQFRSLNNFFVDDFPPSAPSLESVPRFHRRRIPRLRNFRLRNFL